MAKETGTATDYRDLLQKLKNFITGTSSPSSGLTWTVLREYSDQTSPESQLNGADIPNVVSLNPDNVDVHEIIFKGNGGESPERAIYFGIRTYQRSSSSLYNWEIRAYTGYQDSSPETDFHDHPGMSPPCFLPLQNANMNYWFWATERRIVVVVQTGVNYQWLHVGLLNTFATESEYPYPMFVHGSGQFDSNFADNGIAVSGLIDPHGSLDDNVLSGSTYPTGDGTGGGYLRWVDGVWSMVRNRYEQSSQSLSASDFNSGAFGIAPGVDFSASAYLGETFSRSSVFQSFVSNQVAGTPGQQMIAGLGSPEPLPLLPLTVVRPSGGNVVGEVDGVYWVPGTGGVTSEDVVRDSGVSPEKEYIIFQNVHRTDAWTFGAVRDD